MDREALEEDPDWILTDPDTAQWVKQIDDHKYAVYEGEVDYLDTYDIGTMTLNELDEVVEDYYPSLQQMISVSTNDWEMLVAEMLSENAAPAPKQKFLSYAKQ